MGSNVTPMNAAAETFADWWDNFALPYHTLLEQLSKHFRTAFYLQHTGNGDMAIEAWYAGMGIRITDAEQPLSPAGQRETGETGYAVGIHSIESYQIEWPPGLWHRVTDLSERQRGNVRKQRDPPGTRGGTTMIMDVLFWLAN